MMEKQFPLKKLIDHDGNLTDKSYKSKIDESFSKKLYYHMYRIRMFDRKAIRLQRQGRIGTYPPFEGQEASQAGSALALKEDDWMFPTYRDHGAKLVFGADMTDTLLYWNGRIEGCVPPEGRKIFPPAVPIATQLPHAAGAAWAEKLNGTNNAVIVYFGDGATSEGDFHEGINFSSVFKAPVVFFNQNNGYAISVPVARQMNSETIAQKAVAYGIPGIRVDGNDCFAVYFETKKALEYARKGNGPVLIEAVTWRKGAHTTADDPTRYRSDNEGKKFTDPLVRLERFMKKSGFWDEQWLFGIEETVEEEINTSVEEMEHYPKPDVNDLFDHVFARMPDDLMEQKKSYLRYLGGKNDGITHR